MFKNAEKWAKSASSKTGLFGHFFSKCYHSKTNKDIDIKPKPYEAQIPYFSEYESNLLMYIKMNC